MHHEVELHNMIRASILASLDGTLEDGYSHVELDTVSLLDRLADQFRQKRGDADRLRVTRIGLIRPKETNPLFSPHQAPRRARPTKKHKSVKRLN